MHEICSRNTTRSGKLYLTSFCFKNYLLLNFKHVLLKNAFCMKSAQKIQLAVWKLCLTSFWVEHYLLPNYKHVLLKNAFCMKSAQGIPLAVENMISAQKIQLAVRKLCLTSFCVKNYLLPNYSDVLLKNAFCI